MKLFVLLATSYDYDDMEITSVIAAFSDAEKASQSLEQHKELEEDEIGTTYYLEETELV